MTATDIDCGVNSPVTYSLSAPGVIPPEKFAINEQTGVIFLTQQLDYETDVVHEFPVMATGTGKWLLRPRVPI